MPNHSQRAIAIVGVGAVLPDAPDASAFWKNLEDGRYSISEVDSERWDPASYFDDDRQAREKTYSKIGGWVKDFSWEPLEWRLPIPPKVSDAMDRTQKWAIAAAREALLDYGWPDRALDHDRTAVVVGNAMGGDRHYQTALPVYFPEYAAELDAAPTFADLPPATRSAILDEMRAGVQNRFPEISEDTMPGELANIIAGRIANLFNFHGPNFIADAACASAIAAVDAAIEGLEEGDFDAVITGGVDANMSASTFVKFCKIGALSATGTRPYGNGADGFIMGEGAALFVLKRLADAEAAGDKIYAVIRGLAGASDGKGKGITAPNPVGQTLAVQRAWRNAGIAPSAASYIEGHGTSTKVGDVVEVGAIGEAFAELDLPPGTIPLGSVKSNIGHLKGAAGAAGMLKAALSLHHKKIPPSLGATDPNPNIDFAHLPLAVNTELNEWKTSGDEVRSAGVSAFGFGGTNFHAVLEEYVPGRITTNGREAISVATPSSVTAGTDLKDPLRGALLVGGPDDAAVLARLREVQADAAAGNAPEPAPPARADLDADVRVAIDYGDAGELAARAVKACAALESGNPAAWRLLANQGVFLGRGEPHQVAFLYTGQGSQYVNMLAELRDAEPIVARGFDEADAVMEPILGRPLTDVVFVDPADEAAVADAEEQLRQTEITQPAVLTVDRALTEVLGAYGIAPDMVMGHSLGEYGALVAAGAMPFADALEAVAARGKEMANVSVGDNGLMAAVFAPLADIESTIDSIDGYVVVANINSAQQAVIGGATPAVQAAVEALTAADHTAVTLPVSHAFHTEIVAPAAEPLRAVLSRLDLETPHIPIVANVDGEFYPMGPAVVPEMVDILGRQVASPVQFIDGLNTLYDAGARVFVEVGPKRALHGFVDDVLGERDDVVNLFTNHPKAGDVVSFNQALCGLYAAGLGAGTMPDAPTRPAEAASTNPTATAPTRPESSSVSVASAPTTRRDETVRELGELFADFLDRGYELYGGARPAGADGVASDEPVVVTGAALGLPGTKEVFDDANVERLLDGESFIDVIPVDLREAIVDKHITRLVKNASGGGSWEQIGSQHDVMKLAGRAGHFDLVEQFGVPEERRLALDPATELAIGAGIDALRDAGVPLSMRYKTTSTGSKLPEGWSLPPALRDDTGVIFASAFPGADRMIDEISRYEHDRARRDRLRGLEHLLSRMQDDNPTRPELDHMIHEARADIEEHKYEFDRRFLFKALSMGHSQFAEHIGARGPNTQLNSACASTTQAVAVAEDWIRLGRCARVIIIAGDDVTTDTLIEWVGAGFLSTGAAATDEVVEEAALPFDRRRHGMLLGMGGAAIVVESAAAARERGIRPICEVLSTETANSAFHGSRLDVTHIRDVMENLVGRAEQRWGIDRHEIAPATVFVSHETYTPARGGSAQAEVDALRHVFGTSADRIVVANTKGFTGHAMGVGIEDVLAVKALETGIVPPIANVKEVDPELGHLNLSKGGAYPVTYALRLGAGFGSQISMSLKRWIPSPDRTRPEPDELGFEYRIADRAAWDAWLRSISGYDGPALEVDHRVLRIRDDGPPAGVSAPPRPAVASAPPVVAGAPVDIAAPPAPIPEPTRPQRAAAPIPAAATPVEPAAAPPPSAPASDPVEEIVLGLVADQTGYPQDMLDIELDLEADLGIDTVKQAETFAAIREHFDIERDDNLSLRDYPTLAAVIGFVRERAADLPEPAVATADAPLAAAPAQDGMAATGVDAGAPSGDGVEEMVLALVADQTGYPQDMLDLELDLEADLGIDTVKQAETFAAIREHFDIERDDNLSLRDYPTLAAVIGFVRERAEGLPDATPDTPVDAPPPATATVDASPTANAQPATDDGVADVVLGIVAQQTGYPQDMLDLELDLEADLGIDTVKQAETFAAIREHYGIERDDNLSLRDYPTLASVIDFVHERATTLGAGTAPSTDSAETPTITTAVTGDDDAAAAIPRRIPAPVLRPDLDSCVPTGIELGDGDRVIVMLDDGGVGTALVERLRKRGVDVLEIETAPDADTLQENIDAWRGDAPVTGVYWLPALDVEPALADLDLDGWREHLRRRVKLLYRTLRHLYEQVGNAGGFLVSATRLGGLHGYGESGATAPMGGGVAGLTKAFKRERPDALVKAVDFGKSRKTAGLADILIEETLRDPGIVEVGHHDDHRHTIALHETEMPEPSAGLQLRPDTVFVVTGAAGSIVSAIVNDLATASGGTFHLLDLVPEPDPADPDIVAFENDRDGLKRTIFERLGSSGEKVTPVMVEKELSRIERSHEALAAVQAIEAVGGDVHYHSVNLLDADAMRAVTDEIARISGKVDVLMHAGGLEISRLMPDKEPTEYDLVFDVKADGWFNLMKGLGDLPIASSVVFSSIAGRFGNGGQTDYSAANDLLCKLTLNIPISRPDMFGLAVDWTAWGDIGMATRGSIPTVMAAAGIDMLPAAAGIPIVRRELTGDGSTREMLAGQRLGILNEEFHETGGLEVSSFDDALERRPMLSGVDGVELGNGLVVTATLDPTAQPFLDDHRIDGTPVMPGVMGMELFAQVATLPFPERHVAALEDVDFLAPVKFYRDEPRSLRITAQFRADGDDVVAECELVGERMLANQEEPQRTTHFTGRVRLTADEVEVGRAAPPSTSDRSVDADDIYEIYFHGPAYRVTDAAWRSDGSIVGRMADELAVDRRPEDAPLLTSPRLTELCFQTAGVWEIGTTGVMALPMHIERVVPSGREIGEQPSDAVITPLDGGRFDGHVVDGDGTVLLQLEGYRTVQLPGALADDQVAPLRDAMRDGS